jgi:nitroreductase
MNRASIRSWPIVRRILIWKKAWLWARYFLAQSGVFESPEETNSARARLRKDAHALEKGLSLPEIRPFFGRGKIVKLIADIDAARLNPALDADREVAESVLSAYCQWHGENDQTDAFVDSLREQFPPSEARSKLGGTIALKPGDPESGSAGFDSTVLTRRTVRNFSDKRVPREEIEAAIRIAWTSPSVCNRQPWAVALAQEKGDVAQLLRWQAGNRGFSESIDTLLVVLADTKAFVEDYEIFEPFVDAGIFSGVLVNALHARGIGSCCLNLCVSHAVAEGIITELDCPKHYFPIMMIGCGYPQDDCQVAISARGPSVFVL